MWQQFRELATSLQIICFAAPAVVKAIVAVMLWWVARVSLFGGMTAALSGDRYVFTPYMLWCSVVKSIEAVLAAVAVSLLRHGLSYTECIGLSACCVRALHGS